MHAYYTQESLLEPTDLALPLLPDGYEKIPQIGIVILEDSVEIGANTCVDRATMGSYRHSQRSQTDNLIQIAHNDEIGSHTVMAAFAGWYSRFNQSGRMVYDWRSRTCRTCQDWR